MAPWGKTGKVILSLWLLNELSTELDRSLFVRLWLPGFPDATSTCVSNPVEEAVWCYRVGRRPLGCHHG